jgi:hypothetical protein
VELQLDACDLTRAERAPYTSYIAAARALLTEIGRL